MSAVRPAVARPGTPPRWHYLYFLLAALDVFAVSAGLYLSHSIMSIYIRSVEANQTWAARVFDYSQLGALAAEVNAPGNDVFDSREVDTEAARLQAAKDRFDARFAALRAELESELSPQEAAPLLAQLDAVGRAMEAMVDEAKLIFSYFRAGLAERAGERMATMDRRYGTVNKALADLRNAVAIVQQKNFEQQMAAAARQRDFEYGIGALILLMVGGATFYGHRMAKQIQSDFAEKERLLRIAEGQGRLRKRSSELRRANAHLRAEVDQRLLSLQALHDANERLKLVCKTALESHEAERREIARELHEEVAQMLSALKLRLSLLEVEPSMGRHVEPHVKDAGTIAESAIGRLQDMVRELAPHGLESLGLVTVLRVHLDEWTEGSGLDLHFVDQLDGMRPPYRVETAAYRVAKQAVSNVVRHAAARNLRVELSRVRDQLLLEVSDDGVGFDAKAALRRGTPGLAQMEQRAAALGGNVVVDSIPGRGTSVRASFPVFAEVV